MRRFFPLILIMLILAIGLGGWALKTAYQAPKTDFAALDYSAPANWAIRPAEHPAPVWIGGWATDFVVFHPEARIINTRAEDSVDLSRTDQRMTKPAALLASQLKEHGEVYLPYWVDQQGEVGALSDYLINDNKGRALFIVADSPLILSDPDLIAAISNAGAASRFGGVLTPLKASTNLPHEPMEHPEGTTCAKFSEPTCILGLEIDFRAKDQVIKNPTQAATLLASFNTYLNESVAPIAEPLGDFEEIEIIDIRNPGDTDDQRSPPVED